MANLLSSESRNFFCVDVDPNSPYLNLRIRSVGGGRTFLFNHNIEDVVYSIDHYFKLHKKEKITFIDKRETFTSEFLNLVDKAVKVLQSDHGYSFDIFSIEVCAAPVVSSIEQYKKLCSINGWQELSATFTDFFEFRMNEYIQTSNFNTVNYNNKKSHIFLFLNGKPRTHRVYLLLNFIKKNLLDKSLYSFLTTNNRELVEVLDINLNKDFVRKIEPLIHLFDNIKLPKSLTIEFGNLVQRQNVITEEDLYVFDNTYFSLVTETIYFKNEDSSKINKYHVGHLDSIFITEKTYRTIACKHPFIITSRPHTLKVLREFGYKTFSPYIDESYDDIEDDYQRLDRIIDIISDLCSKDENFWYKFYEDTRSIVEHNYQILKNSRDRTITYNPFDN